MQVASSPPSHPSAHASAPRPRVAPLPVAPTTGVALALAAPAALGALLTTIAREPSPIVAVPAIAFGVIAATSPALYIASTAAGGAAGAPPLAAFARALGVAFGAFGVALAGLVLPTTFLALSSASAGATLAVTSAALGAAAVLGLVRLAAELGAERPPSARAALVFIGWAVATLGIAARLWLELAQGVAS